MRYLIGAAAATALLGGYALFEAARHLSWIDDDRFLQEPFAWMTSGKVLLSFSVIFLITAGVMWLFRTWRGKLTG